MRVTATCLLAIALAGCEGPAATAAGPATAPATPAASVAATVASVAPAASETGRPTAPAAPALPAGFPVHESMVGIEAPPGVTAAWTSDATPPEVYDFYLAALPDAGFEIDDAAPGGAVAVLRFHAADGVAYQLDMSGVETITLLLGPPHP